MKNDENIEIKFSKKHGQGSFAKRDFKKGEEVYLITEDRLINHSCEPNTEDQGSVGVALRDINADDEITVDYDKFVAVEEPFLCNCAAKTCRGIIIGKVTV